MLMHQVLLDQQKVGSVEFDSYDGSRVQTAALATFKHRHYSFYRSNSGHLNVGTKATAIPTEYLQYL